jgi:putative FmdB family regulatory protein
VLIKNNNLRGDIYMPVYEFSCKNCTHIFEGLYPVGTKAENLECPLCKEKTLRKIFSTFAVSSRGGSGDFSSLSNTGSSRSKCSSCGGGSCSTCS